MDIIKISLLGVCGVMLGFFLKGSRPEYAAFVTMGIGLMILGLAVRWPPEGKSAAGQRLFFYSSKNGRDHLYRTVFSRDLQGCRLSGHGGAD